MEKKDLKSMDLNEVTAFVTELGEKPFRAKQLYQWMHQKLAPSLEDMTNLPKAFRERLLEHGTYTSLETVQMLESGIDGTRKYLFGLGDGNIIESVLMKYKHGNSVCISSQVGCRMGCRFCASTLDGLTRNLTAGEMLDQIYRIQASTGERVSNVVVMGSGEPFDNYDSLVKFIRLLSDENGLNISQRNITVSTCGIVPGIRKFAEEGFSVTLALSLHAPNDQVRKTLMPIANKYSLSEILPACKEYYEKTGRRLTFEYSLVQGVNDNLDEARKLSSLIKDMHGHVNLIPVNPIKERDYRQSGREAIDAFRTYLEKQGDGPRHWRRLRAAEKKLSEKGRGGRAMNSYGQTDTGRVRKSNQDSIFLSETPVGPLSNLFMVADGMGGHKAGDFASRFVVDTMVRCMGLYKSDSPVTALRKAIEKTNELLFLEAQRDPDREGMGSTLVAATVDQDTMYVANVGDSRLYLFRDGLSQITRDHSLVEEMVSLGKLERNSESYRSQKNIITRAVGIRPAVTADFFEVSLKKDDCVLLCSDGLSNMAEESLIGSILAAPAVLKEKTSRLIQAANENGGKDNIAVILIEPQISEVGV